MSKRVKRQITERDYKMLRFLWKWKTVSTAALAKKFFPEILPDSAYRRLRYLEEDNYIESVVVNGRFHEVWTLKDKGFKYIKEQLGELKSQGYKSEYHRHDYLVTAFHLGEWLTHQPNNSQTYTEQQLRCFAESLWPEWIPKSSLHRPDGFSALNKNNKLNVFAFEVELNFKAVDRYERVVTYYNSQSSIDAILWLVDSRNVLLNLKKVFSKYNLSDQQKHNFILVQDFLIHGWNTKIIEGQYINFCLSELMHPSDIQTTSNGHQRVDALALLNSRKRPIISSK